MEAKISYGSSYSSCIERYFFLYSYSLKELKFSRGQAKGKLEQMVEGFSKFQNRKSKELDAEE